MFKNFILAAALLLSAYVPASAVVIQTPPHRSAIQEECIKDNPQDHQGYLACIRSKREEKKNAKGNTVPASAPVYDANQPVENK